MSGQELFRARTAKVGATLAALVLSAMAPLSSAAISYSQDFESLDAEDANALAAAGFTVFANVFEPDGTSFLYGYGPFVAPNGTGGFSNVAVGEGGAEQGANQIVTFSDYNNADHGVGRVIESNVFLESTLAANEVGAPYEFTFDAKLGDIAGSSTASAFILTLDPNAGFAVTSQVEIDLTATPATWESYTLSITLGTDKIGQILQFGFRTRATNFEASGIFYDNLAFNDVSLESYAQDFEGLDAMSGTALAEDGWLVFANVFDTEGTFLYNYGPFVGPNGTGGFSNVAVGEGGPDQGDQQIVIFNDYNNPDHNNGFIIEASVFQEQSIGLSDVGETYIFEFDAKLGDLTAPSLANAFIKTLDPTAGFALTNLIELETETLPTTWGTYTLSITITSDLVGQLLQFGFDSAASNFAPSGVVYDNLSFGRDLNDADGDGIDDDIDNCLGNANPNQVDADGDGYGNLCDADFNNDCTVNFVDLGILRTVFFSADAQADLNVDGVVNFVDLGILRQQFFGTPGPSGQGGICDTL